MNLIKKVPKGTFLIYNNMKITGILLMVISLSIGVLIDIKIFDNNPYLIFSSFFIFLSGIYFLIKSKELNGDIY